VVDTKAAFQEVLRTARLPLRLLPELEQALEAEPALRGTAFGVSQAVTRAAQSQKPEERFRLEWPLVLTSRKRRARAHKVTASSDGPLGQVESHLSRDGALMHMSRICNKENRK